MRSPHWRNLIMPAAAVAAVAVWSAYGLTGSPPAAPVPAAAAPAPATYPVVIHRPSGPPTVATGEVDEGGRPIRANCSTCHATRPPDPTISRGDQLDEFHEGLTMNHGGLTCLSCHNRDEYRQLRLADDRPVEFADVMRLCAQCHGPQHRDYQHGSHGGMVGYWDLTRGGRRRNNCIDCHDAHAPQYPRVRPAAGPNDRFFGNHAEGGGHE